MQAMIQPKPAWAEVVEELITYLDTREGIEDAAELAAFDTEYGERIEGMVRTKVEALTFVWKQLEAWSEQCREEARTYAARAKQLDAKLELLKGRIVDGLQAVGLKKMETATGGFRLHPSQVVEVADMAKLPFIFQRCKLQLTVQQVEIVRFLLLENGHLALAGLFEELRDVEPMKTAIKAALAAGPVPGADLKDQYSAVLLKPKGVAK